MFPQNKWPDWGAAPGLEPGRPLHGSMMLPSGFLIRLVYPFFLTLMTPVGPMWSCTPCNQSCLPPARLAAHALLAAQRGSPVYPSNPCSRPFHTSPALAPKLDKCLAGLPGLLGSALKGPLSSAAGSQGSGHREGWRPRWAARLQLPVLLPPSLPLQNLTCQAKPLATRQQLRASPHLHQVIIMLLSRAPGGWFHSSSCGAAFPSPCSGWLLCSCTGSPGLSLPLSWGCTSL